MIVGLDLGSRTVKVAAMAGGRLLESRVEESTFDLAGQCRRLVARYRPQRVIATGYGRHLARQVIADEVITEIRAHALGARYLIPDCTTVLDVGGQDSKVIILDARGRVANFQMNDRCAAGTGRFLEIMAAGLGFPLAGFGPVALSSSADLALSSMCAVFAESEVISLKHQGHPAGDVARAVHLSVVGRLAAMLLRHGLPEKLVFTGGVAANPAMIALLAERLGIEVAVPAEPAVVGALGAALAAGDGA